MDYQYKCSQIIVKKGTHYNVTISNENSQTYESRTLKNKGRNGGYKKRHMQYAHLIYLTQTVLYFAHSSVIGQNHFYDIKVFHLVALPPEITFAESVHHNFCILLLAINFIQMFLKVFEQTIKMILLSFNQNSSFEIVQDFTFT